MTKFVRLQSIADLKRGDIIRHASPDAVGSYVVEGVYGEHATAVRSIDITNPREWEVMRTYEAGDEIRERVDSGDLIGALCLAVKEAGGKMTLYGLPITEEELREHAAANVVTRLSKRMEPEPFVYRPGDPRGCHDNVHVHAGGPCPEEARDVEIPSASPIVDPDPGDQFKGTPPRRRGG